MFFFTVNIFWMKKRNNAKNFQWDKKTLLVRFLFCLTEYVFREFQQLQLNVLIGWLSYPFFTTFYIAYIYKKCFAPVINICTLFFPFFVYNSSVIIIFLPIHTTERVHKYILDTLSKNETRFFSIYVYILFMYNNYN